MLNAKAFDLLAGLEADNSKDWFDAHRDEMRDFVQRPFAEVLVAITERLADGPMPLTGGEKTMYRMNRDVRFSRDKSPYSAHASGVLTRSGTKGESDGLTYLHLDARGGFVASGFYGLAPKNLAPIRDRIVERPEVFEEAVEALTAKGYALSQDDKLTAMPQGFSQHADEPFASYLKLKSLIVRKDLTKANWTSGSVVEEAVRLTTVCAPLIAFGRAARG